MGIIEKAKTKHLRAKEVGNGEDTLSPPKPLEVEPISESVMQRRTSQIEEQNFVANCAIPHMKGKKMEDNFSKSFRSVG